MILFCVRCVSWVIPIMVFVSCAPDTPEESPPSGLIARDTFTRVMVDVQLIEGMRVHKLGPKKDKAVDMTQLYADVFAEHNITEERFRRTFAYYKEHPDRMEDIYEGVADSLTTLEVAVKRAFQVSETARRDSINRAMGRKVDSTARPLAPE